MALFMANFFLCPLSLICHVTINSAVHIAVKEPSCMSYLHCLYTLTIWVTWHVSYERQVLLTLRGRLDSSWFWWGPCCWLVVFVCCVAFFLFLVFFLSCVPNVANCSGLSIHNCRKKTRCFHRNGIIITFWVDMLLPWERFLIKTWKW